MNLNSNIYSLAVLHWKRKLKWKQKNNAAWMPQHSLAFSIQTWTSYNERENRQIIVARKNNNIQPSFKWKSEQCFGLKLNECMCLSYSIHFELYILFLLNWSIMSHCSLFNRVCCCCCFFRNEQTLLHSVVCVFTELRTSAHVRCLSIISLLSFFHSYSFEIQYFCLTSTFNEQQPNIWNAISVTWCKSESDSSIFIFKFHIISFFRRKYT